MSLLKKKKKIDIFTKQGWDLSNRLVGTSRNRVPNAI